MFVWVNGEHMCVHCGGSQNRSTHTHTYTLEHPHVCRQKPTHFYLSMPFHIPYNTHTCAKLRWQLTTITSIILLRSFGEIYLFYNNIEILYGVCSWNHFQQFGEHILYAHIQYIWMRGRECVWVWMWRESFDETAGGCFNCFGLPCLA